MVRSIADYVGAKSTFSPIIIPLEIYILGLFVSATLLVALCAKHARKYTTKTSDDETNTPYNKKSPLPSPKQLISTLLIHHHHAKKPGQQKPDTGTFGDNNNDSKEMKKGQLEESNINSSAGLWQKAILMGDKCRPPDFSGAIYYDYDGNRVPEMPMSPRAGTMSPLRNFTFPVDKSIYS